MRLSRAIYTKFDNSGGLLRTRGTGARYQLSTLPAGDEQMPIATFAETHTGPTPYARAARPYRAPDASHDAFSARREALAKAAADKPLTRIAALLLSISRNNGYEGRDPKIMPDTLTSGFVADLLGLDIGSLELLLVDLRRRGLVESDASSTLRLRDLSALESLADA
jgi:hypothetical protein